MGTLTRNEQWYSSQLSMGSKNPMGNKPRKARGNMGDNVSAKILKNKRKTCREEQLTDDKKKLSDYVYGSV